MRGDRDFRVGQADALAVGDAPADVDPRHRAVGGGLDDMQPQLAIVDQQIMAGRQRQKDFRMGQADARGVAGRRVGIEGEILPRRSGPRRRRRRRRRAISAPADRRECRSAGRPASSTARIIATVSRMACGSAWLILMRNTSAPARQSLSIEASSFEAGPSVARILQRRRRLFMDFLKASFFCCRGISASDWGRSTALSSSWRPCRCPPRKSRSGHSRAESNFRGPRCGIRGRACT